MEFIGSSGLENGIGIRRKYNKEDWTVVAVLESTKDQRGMGFIVSKNLKEAEKEIKTLEWELDVASPLPDFGPEKVFKYIWRRRKTESTELESV